MSSAENQRQRKEGLQCSSRSIFGTLGPRIHLCIIFACLISFSTQSWTSSASPPGHAPHIQPKKVSKQRYEQRLDTKPSSEKKKDAQSEGIFQFSNASKGSLDLTRHPIVTYPLLDGTFLIGQEVSIGGKKLVITRELDSADNHLREAAALLTQPILSTLTAVSMLHAKADAAIVRDVKKKWGNENFVENPTSKEHIKNLFVKSWGERFVFFGHIESTTNGSANYVTLDHNNKPSLEIPFSWIQERAHEYKVEVIFIGCNTFSAGASAGVLHVIPGQDLPQIIEGIKGAQTRAEIYASFSSHDNPTFINPRKLVDELSKEHVEIQRTRDTKPIAIHTRPTYSPSIQMASSHTLDSQILNTVKPRTVYPEGNNIARLMSLGGIYLLIVWGALAFVLLQVGLFDPINQIIKYQNYRYGRFSRLRRVFGKIAVDMERMEPADPAQESSPKGGVGCFLMLLTPFGFTLGVVPGFVSTIILALFFTGHYCRELNKEYER